MREILPIAKANQHVYRTARVHIHHALLALVYQDVRQTCAAEGEIPFFATFDNDVRRTTTVKFGITKLGAMQNHVGNTATVEMHITSRHV
ncbi:hypothetical protein DN41_3392 [Vibrio cholerae]|nr:hypothetical protein DN41_3392 [Vibrio cholerae]